MTWGDPRAGGDSSSVQSKLRFVLRVQATQTAFAALLYDGSVVTWGQQRHGGDSSTVQDELRNVQQVQARGKPIRLHTGSSEVHMFRNPKE